MDTRAIAPALLLLAVGAGTAHAGGIGRPNVISARALGWGGAFTAIADDASALHYNPAGLALQPRDSIVLGGSFVLAPRRYTPVYADGTRGEDQEPESSPIIVPYLGYSTRLWSQGIPSRVALGIGVWNTFGGQLTYPKGNPSVPALDATQTAVIEVVPGVAYEVNDFLSIGAGFRVGIGLFSVEATNRPRDGEFSAFGFGAGVSLGLMIKPVEELQVGVAWRSSLTTRNTGSGTMEINPGDVRAVEVKHKQEWPQQASVGVSYRVTPKLRFSTQADWTDWSKMDKIIVEFPGQDALTAETTYHVDFQDNYALHAGAEVLVTPKIAARGGYTFDSNAVPDAGIERQYLDGPKHIFGVGGGYQLTKRWRTDCAFEYIHGGVRLVEDNRPEMQVAGWTDGWNVSPGEHVGQVYSLELNLQYQY